VLQRSDEDVPKSKLQRDAAKQDGDAAVSLKVAGRIVQGGGS